MFYIILAALLLFFTAIMLLMSRSAPTEQPTWDRTDRYAREPSPVVTRSSYVTLAICSIAAFVVLTVFFSATLVSARTVGLYQSLGKEAGTKAAGLGWTAPWTNKEEFPTDVQYLQLNKTDDGKDFTSPVGVSYDGGGKGEVDVTVRWTLNPAKARDLWRKYREFGKVTEQLVTSTARDAVGVVVGAYGPSDAQSGANRPTMTTDVAKSLNASLSDDGVRIDSVSISDVRLDDKTQQSVEAIVKAEAATKVATANKATATIDNETANLRAKSAALGAGALQLKCLEVTNSWDNAKNGPLPATWNCLGGTPASVVVGH